jgi:hypothetical protein
MLVGDLLTLSLYLFQIIMLQLNNFFADLYSMKCIYSFIRYKCMFCWQKVINSYRSVFISCSQACNCSKKCCNRPFRREKQVEIVKVRIAVDLSPVRPVYFSRALFNLHDLEYFLHVSILVHLMTAFHSPVSVNYLVFLFWFLLNLNMPQSAYCISCLNLT